MECTRTWPDAPDWVVFHTPAAESAQASVAQTVAAEGQTRQEAVEAVRRSTGKGGDVPQYSGPGPTRDCWSSSGRGLDDKLIRIALVDVLGQLDATRLTEDQAVA